MSNLIQRRIGLIAILTPVWFASLYFVMTALRPDFSHSTKAVSELGSLDAPYLWIWNIGGYMLPGIAVALLGAGIASHFRGEPKARLASYPLVVSGLMMSVSGIFPGDFDHRTSPTMILHAVGSIGSFLAFLVTGFSIPWLLRRSANWRPYAWPSLFLVVLLVVSGFFRSGESPGIGQRIGFLLFFAWVALIGSGLLCNARTERSVGAN